MTIDPKAAELAKALADAVAAQQTEEYREWLGIVERVRQIDAAAEEAERDLRAHITGVRSNAAGAPGSLMGGGWVSGARYHDFKTKDVYVSKQPVTRDPDIFDPHSEPERYELPEDETATAKPNGGLSD